MEKLREKLIKIASYQAFAQELLDEGEMLGLEVAPIHLIDIRPYFNAFGGEVVQIIKRGEYYHVTAIVLNAKVLTLYAELPSEFSPYYKEE